MPPRADRPHGRNRVRRPARNTQNDGSPSDAVENPVAGTNPDGGQEITVVQDPARNDTDVPFSEGPAQQTAPLTLFEWKEKKSKQSKAKSVSGPAQENPRRPKHQKTKSQPKAVKAPRDQTPHHTQQTTPKPTPIRAGIFSETPSKLYAGPNFHTSPAASSLPLPRFLSKSVPNVDKAISLRGMMEQDNPEISSNSDDPPSNGTATPDPSRHAREESPLDFFFRADREAKARKSSARPDVLASARQDSSPNSLAVSGPVSLGPRTTRHHARTRTDGSNNGLFPFEMEHTASALQPLESSPLISDGPDSSKSTTPATNGIVDPLHEKSMALRKLLNSNESPPANHGSQNPGQSAGDRTTPPFMQGTEKHSSARPTGIPLSFPNGLEGTTADQRRAALLALAEKQISMPAHPSTQRPASSGLRKEFRMPESTVTSQNQYPPSTPTPSRRGERPGPGTRSQRAPATTGRIPTFPTVHPGNTQPLFASPSKGRDSSMKSMEDDLRRILKLDVITSDGATGVKS